MSALVRVRGHRVTLQLRNRTTHEAFSKTITMRAPDTSSANWIAEAPTMRIKKRDYLFPLTDFGTIRFTNARATSADGHRGTIGDPAWKPTRVYFSSTHRHSNPSEAFFNEMTAAHVIPGALSPGGDAFTATWHAGRPKPLPKAKPGSGDVR
jgi:hypothetical protein